MGSGVDYDEDGEVILRADPFDVKYLKSFNESITETIPEDVRAVNNSLLKSRNVDAGINKSIFSVGDSELSSVVRPTVGVTLKSDRLAIDGGSVAKQSSRMSIDRYKEIAEKYKSLANIGATPKLEA